MDKVKDDKKKSLFAVIDRCLTTHGKALLRANLLQPATDEVTIRERQRAALDLSDDYVFDNVKISLKDMLDVDRIRTCNRSDFLRPISTN